MTWVSAQINANISNYITKVVNQQTANQQTDHLKKKEWNVLLVETHASLRKIDAWYSCKAEIFLFSLDPPHRGASTT